MTAMAQRYEVFKLICFTVIKEVGETADMMNVKFFPNIITRNTAFLAGVFVSLARCRALFFPIGAVIVQMTTTPGRIASAGQVYAIIRKSALIRAKRSFALPQLPRFTREFSITVKACEGNRRNPSWMLIAANLIALKCVSWTHTFSEQVTLHPIGMQRSITRLLTK